MAEAIYLCVDLKSFYASVECMERGLDPLTTHLVVADLSRTEKTICLAVTPSLKAYGISGRARLFEVVEQVGLVNGGRRQHAPLGRLEGDSFDAIELEKNPNLSATYVVAPPRMAHYMDYSGRIYQIYLKYISPQDIHVYSIDEVFIYLTPYLDTYQTTAAALASDILQDILETTGITATAGLGTNPYLAKVAMDILAKSATPNQKGHRIAQLDEISYRHQLWNHRPITDFWRVGKGLAKKLAQQGLYTMGDVARCSLGKEEDYHNQALVYRLFGVNGELLIDHAWGLEPCTMPHIKGYKAKTNSIHSGQVLHTPYTYQKARLVVREMTDLLALDLLKRGLVTSQLVLTIGYDRENLQGQEYQGEIALDPYGRPIPKQGHGTYQLGEHSASAERLMEGMMSLYETHVNPDLMVRRVTLVAGNLRPQNQVEQETPYEQLDFFTQVPSQEGGDQEKEAKKQQAILSMQEKYGKSAILKAISLEEGATAKERNRQIGGHKA